MSRMVNIDGKTLSDASSRRRKRQFKIWRCNSTSLSAVTLLVAIAVVAIVLSRYNIAPTANMKAVRGDRNRLLFTCQYDGNCPVGALCEDGVCLPYLSKRAMSSDHDNTRPDSSSTTSNSLQFEKCFQACKRELQMDEWYFHGSVPVVKSKYPALHGHGCILEYRRIHKAKAKSLPWRTVDGVLSPPTVDEWMRQRLRQIRRVDPSWIHRKKKQPPATNDDTTWLAVCDHPCESSSDCQPATSAEKKLDCVGRVPSSVPPGISASPKSCRRIVNRNDKEKPSNDEMVIVSASNHAYFQALQNLAASLKYWSPQRKLVVYNLGMDEDQLDAVKGWSNVLHLRWPRGIPARFPTHIRDNLKNYAWKPIIINETVHEFKSILWHDAGSTFTGPLEPIEEILHQHGTFLLRGQDEDMKPMSHPSTYEWFGFSKSSFHASGHYSGNIQGYLHPSRYIDTIVVPNAQCALDVNCIAPDGSSLQNHRYDQTSLSILAHQRHIRAPHYTEYLAASQDQLNSEMRQPNRIISWTSRGRCDFYSDMNIL